MNEDDYKRRCENFFWKLKNKKQTWNELYESKKHMLCAECDNSIGRNSNIFDMRLFKDCKAEPKYKTICKSTAKKRLLFVG